MGKKRYRKAAGMFAVFSHPTRLLIVIELLKGAKCVASINKLVKVQQPNISQHLSLLRLHGIVKTRKEGKTVCYSLKNIDLIKRLHDFIQNNNLE